jgi:hypothetical protein
MTLSDQRDHVAPHAGLFGGFLGMLSLEYRILVPLCELGKGLLEAFYPGAIEPPIRARGAANGSWWAAIRSP